MSDRAPRPPGGNSQGTSTLELLRVKWGTTEVVRTLSATYRGVMTHYVKGRSRTCYDAEECDNHDLDAVWKGYCCVELWLPNACLWIPKVLEISESLDQDFFGRFGRGQVWEVTHLKKGDSKKIKAGKVVAKFWEQLDPYTLPEPYNMQPVLDLTYHEIGVRLPVDNPLPRRVQVSASKGPAPNRPGQAAAKPVTQEQLRRIEERCPNVAARLAAEPGANGKDGAH